MEITHEKLFRFIEMAKSFGLKEIKFSKRDYRFESELESFIEENYNAHGTLKMTEDNEQEKVFVLYKFNLIFPTYL